MSSFRIRNPQDDHLLTPANAQLACELQRDRARKDTAGIMVNALKHDGAFLDM